MRSFHSKFFSRLTPYLKGNFRHDLVSGVVVGLVALPLAIAFAMASGAKPEQGLYSSIFAGGLVAFLSGSRYQITGPTGAFVVLLLGIVNQYGISGLLTAGFMAGIMLVLLGVFRIGATIKFIPYPVTVGFTAGIGTIIFFGQIQDFFGLQFSHKPHGFVDIIFSLTQGFVHGINLKTALVGLTTLSIFWIWPKINKKLPSTPLAMLVGTLVSLPFGESIKRIGFVPTSLPTFEFIHLSFATIQHLFPAALAIAMLGAIESLLSSVVADGMTGTKHNSNKELIAQGIGNIVAPLLGGIPVTGAIARTAVNIRNGARSRVSGVIHSITLLVMMLYFANYARFIPLASLAAILMVVSYQMSEFHHLVRLFRSPFEDIAVLVTTYLLTVFLDLTVAVGAGFGLAALLFIKRASEINVVSLEDNTKTGSEAALRLKELIKDYPQISLYEINGPMFFGAASFLEESIEHESGEILILTLKNVPVIDATALHALDLIVEKIQNNKGQVILVSLQPHVKEVLESHGLLDRIGGNKHTATHIDQAINQAIHLLKPSV